MPSLRLPEEYNDEEGRTGIYVCILKAVEAGWDGSKTVGQRWSEQCVMESILEFLEY